MSQSPISFFFYSNYCSNCKQVIHELNQCQKIKNTFRFVCIDSSSVRKKLPRYVNSVPCVILGQSNQQLVGSEIINWLKLQRPASANSRILPQHHDTHPAHASQPKHTQHENHGNQQESIAGWHHNEMNNFSDMYSFVDADTSAQGNGGISMPHNFELICPVPAVPEQKGYPQTNHASQHRPGSGMPSMNYSGFQNTESQSTMNKMMDDYLSKREMDIPNVPARVG